MVPHYVFIHGANQNSSCWDYIVKILNPTDYTFIDYDSKFSFDENLNNMIHQIKSLKNIFFVSHSLGGIYSVHLYNQYQNNVVGAVTLSTPYGGSSLAKIFKYMFPTVQLFQDICPRSDPISQANMINIQVPWTQIVSVNGHNPVHILPNDGVVTIHSMMYRDDIDYIKIDCDHYNILQSKEVVEHINILSRSS